MAVAISPARAHAAAGPAVNPFAAARAARSAAACARCLATTADPKVTARIAVTVSAATITAASTVAEPLSSVTRFGRGHGLPGDDDAGKNRRAAGDPRDDEAALAA